MPRTLNIAEIAQAALDLAQSKEQVKEAAAVEPAFKTDLGASLKEAADFIRACDIHTVTNADLLAVLSYEKTASSAVVTLNGNITGTSEVGNPLRKLAAELRLNVGPAAEATRVKAAQII